MQLQRWSAWEQTLTAQSSTLGSFERLSNLDATAEYERMIEDVRCKAVQEPAKKTKEQPSPKFHVYAVGVALTPGNFTVEWSSSNYLNGGSNLNYFSDHHKNAPMRKFKVHLTPPLLAFHLFHPFHPHFFPQFRGIRLRMYTETVCSPIT